MEQSHYLIDTNAVIDYLGDKFHTAGMEFMHGIVDVTPNVSVITKIELLGFNAPESHYQVLENFINDSNVFDLTENIVDMCIDIRKQHNIKLPDAIIAATALIYDLILISRHSKDFQNIPGLKVVDLYLSK